jgi:hypothetical protein
LQRAIASGIAAPSWMCSRRNRLLIGHSPDFRVIGRHTSRLTEEARSWSASKRSWRFGMRDVRAQRRQLSVDTASSCIVCSHEFASPTTSEAIAARWSGTRQSIGVRY